MMRNQATQYLAVILCLLVIGQDFCAGRVADEIIKRYGAKREALAEEKSLSDEEDANEKTKELVTLARKKRTVGKVLFGAAFLASVGGVGFQLYLAHGDGCCELYSSICTDEERFIKYRALAKTVSDQIDNTYSAAEILFEWAHIINYRVQELWIHILRITGLKDQIVEGINPSIITQLQNTSLQIQAKVKEKNETGLTYTDEDLNLDYKTVWDDTESALKAGFYLASYPLSLLANRLINIFISRSINKLAATLNTQYGTVLRNSLQGNGKAASFFGVKTIADVDANVQATAKAIKNGQHAKTATWGPRIAKAFTIVSSAATIVLEAWAGYQTVADCEKLVDEVDDAADDIKEVYENNVKLNTTITEYFGNITYYYDDVRTQLTSDDLNTVLEEIRNITLYAYDGDRLQFARDAIDEWFANIGDATESETYDLLQTLNDGLGNVSYSLECYRNKYRAITYVSKECAEGDGTLKTIYSDAVTDFNLNQPTCTKDSGYLLTTFDNMEEIIEGLAEKEGYNCDCILNSNSTLNFVCNKFWDGYDDSYIMKKKSLNAEQLEYFIANCGNQPLTPLAQDQICWALRYNKTSGTVTVASIANLVKLDNETVEAGIKNCDEEDANDETTELVTLARKKSLGQDEGYNSDSGSKPLDLFTQGRICRLVKLNETVGSLTVAYIAFLVSLDEKTAKEGIDNCDEVSSSRRLRWV